MKQWFLLVCVLVFLTACNNNYRYVEILRERSLLGGSSIIEKEEMISASSDSSAYIEAFTKYCISQKVYSDMREKVKADYLDVPIGFKLYNPEGVDISNLSFEMKSQIEEKLVASILAMDNVVLSSKGESNSGNIVSESHVDSVKIKELLPFFEVKKDEFDPDGITWYRPKSAPKFANRNAIYFYFGIREGKVMPLRFTVQYCSDEWIFLKMLQFSIDDKAYEYKPSRTEKDCGNGGEIWEWFDEALSRSEKDLIYALVGAKSAKMKIIGRQYYDIKNITKKQVTDMKRTLELYRAMGGIY